MADSGVYYLNGETFITSTSIFSDANLTTLAPDGYYSDGTWVRQQLNGKLHPAVNCPSCLPPCGDGITADGLKGVYYLNMDVGGTEDDVGAVIIVFNPFNIPDGIQVEYNGDIYNELSSQVYGYLGGISGRPTYIGDEDDDCGISGQTFNLNVFEYNGTDFESTGETEEIQIVAGQLQMTTNLPQRCYMVIPKPHATPNEMMLKFIGPCTGTVFSLTVNCPALLPSFSGSINANSPENVCTLEIDRTYYHAPVNGLEGVVDLYDWVFSDAYGMRTLGDGYYKFDGNPSYTWFRAQNGVVVERGDC